MTDPWNGSDPEEEKQENEQESHTNDHFLTPIPTLSLLDSFYQSTFWSQEENEEDEENPNSNKDPDYHKARMHTNFLTIE